MLGELTNDIGPDYKDKEIGYEAGQIDKEFYELFEADIESLNELMEKEKCQS